MSVIPAIDIIDQMLTTFTIPTRKESTKISFSPAVKTALKLGQQTLNRYYSKTDDSVVYRIAMSECTKSYPGHLTDDRPQFYTLGTRHGISSVLDGRLPG